MQLRRLFALLSIAVLLLAVVAPASSGLLFAVLVPLAPIAIACTSAAMRRDEETPEVPKLVFLSLLAGRAPPVL